MSKWERFKSWWSTFWLGVITGVAVVIFSIYRSHLPPWTFYWTIFAIFVQPLPEMIDAISRVVRRWKARGHAA